jgi:hypothetical protein
VLRVINNDTFVVIGRNRVERKSDEDNKASEKQDSRREFMNISLIDQRD